MRVEREVRQRLPHQVKQVLQNDEIAIAQKHKSLEQQQQQIEQGKRVLLWLATGAKSNLAWLGGRFLSGVAKAPWYWTTVVAYSLLGFTIGINRPPIIGCLDVQSDCYLLRWNKTEVILPPLKSIQKIKNKK